MERFEYRLARLVAVKQQEPPAGKQAFRPSCRPSELRCCGGELPYQVPEVDQAKHDTARLPDEGVIETRCVSGAPSLNKTTGRPGCFLSSVRTSPAIPATTALASLPGMHRTGSCGEPRRPRRARLRCRNRPSERPERWDASVLLCVTSRSHDPPVLPES
jgi:hypothetical protein